MPVVLGVVVELRRRSDSMVQVGNCQDCGSSVLHARGRCSPCYWKAKREAAMQCCPGCGKRRVLRPEAGLCGMCVRKARPRKQPTPRICRACGRLAIHDGHGLCSRCYQRDPARMPTWTMGALVRLGEAAPTWFAALAEDLAQRCAPQVAAEHMRKVERLVADGAGDAATLIAGLRTEGRSPGATTRLVDEFFTRTGAGSHLDEVARRAHQRRERRLDSVPAALRPAVSLFNDYLIGSRSRAALVGGHGLADSTIETRIADLGVLARQLTERGITDWAAVATADIEAFLLTNPGQRLASARMFFAFARRRRLILTNPTRTIIRKAPRGFAGRVLDIKHQRHLLRRWTRIDLDPRERVVGLLSLIHGTSCAELRRLKVRDIDLATSTLQLAGRPHPLPLDPLSSDAIGAVLRSRAEMKTDNPHLLITKDSRAHQTACSPYFMTHVLDGAEVSPSVLRQTRLADLAHRIDPRLVAAAFGMTQGGALHYVTDAVDGEDHVFSSHL